MVSVMIRMKLAVLRHSMRGRQAENTISGISIGLLLAAGTIWIAIVPFNHAATSIDLLAVIFAVWMVGWILGPVFAGGGDKTLRPEHFTLLPISSRRLAFGLLGAAFVGVAPAITLIALLSIVVYAVRLGVVAAMVALPATLLQMTIILLASRVTTSFLGGVMRFQLGSALVALVSAIIMAISGSGWALLPATDQLISQGFPAGLSLAVRLLPSGWGIVAVDATSQSNWLLASGALLGQLVLIGLLLFIWAELLVHNATTRPTRSGQAVSRQTQRAQTRFFPATPLGAALEKELRTLLRDPMHMHFLYFAFFYAILFCSLPLATNTLVMLPWTGIMMVAASSMTSNLYGMEGSSLWLTLVTPGAERLDVRGKQYVWLLLVTPPALLLTLFFTLMSGQNWAWPWILAMMPAMLGGAAGLIVLVSVLYLVPRPEAHKRNSNDLQQGGDFAQSLLILVLVLITAVPAVAVMVGGAVLGNSLLLWSGTLVGIGTGILYMWLFGKLAYHRLETRGPELLHLMRTGADAANQPKAAEVGAKQQISKKMVAMFCLTICWIPLVPQGLVPLFIKLNNSDVRSWFLALYLPEPYQWITIIAMIVMGLIFLITGLLLQRKVKQKARTQTQ